jgi:hypothetical protein
MLWFCFWMMALWNDDRGQAEATDLMRPPTWSGNFWGPAAWRARMTGELPPLPTNSWMARWGRWGQRNLQEGDIVFRLGDARIVRGIVPASLFIAKATGSPFSHTGIVAIEEGSPVVYDVSSEGIQRSPFDVWMLDCVGPFGVKRLKAEHRRHIPGVVAYCRKIFEQQMPFDFLFSLDDTAFYCLELTEKAFRSQGLALSDPVRIGDWEFVPHYRLTTVAMLYFAGITLGRPIPIEQPTYLPGNDRQGVWASPFLETVVGPVSELNQDPALRHADGPGRRGDFELFALVGRELRRSYQQLPVRWISRLAVRAQALASTRQTAEYQQLSQRQTAEADKRN